MDREGREDLSEQLLIIQTSLDAANLKLLKIKEIVEE